MSEFIVVTDDGRYPVLAHDHAEALQGLGLGNPLDEIHDGREICFRFADGTEVSVLKAAA